MLLHLAFSVFIIVMASVLMSGHQRAWQRQHEVATSDEEREFFFRRYRRRMQTSGMLAVVGVAIAVGFWVRIPWVALIYWGVVGLLLLWILLLAAADLINTQMLWTRERNRHRRQQAEIEAELARLKKQSTEQTKRDGNGKPKPR